MEVRVLLEAGSTEVRVLEAGSIEVRVLEAGFHEVRDPLEAGFTEVRALLEADVTEVRVLLEAGSPEERVLLEAGVTEVRVSIDITTLYSYPAGNDQLTHEDRELSLRLAQASQTAPNQFVPLPCRFLLTLSDCRPYTASWNVRK